jgi:short-subunit dehydrogenase
MSGSSSVGGRVVAITGGANGIGAATGRLLASRGAKVALGDIDEAAAHATAASMAGEVIGHSLDVTSTASFTAFLAHVEETLGPIDVLVNNAGVMWVGRFDEEPEAAALRQLEVNFHGVARGMRLVLPKMRARARGQIVNVASVASKVAPAGEATYAASKHAVLGYSTALRQELRGTQIQISVVMPIVVDTQLAAGTSPGGMPALTPGAVAQAILGAIERPRFEVFVPARVGALARVLALLPQAGRDLLYRRLVPDQVAETDVAARRAYEARMVDAPPPES